MRFNKFISFLKCFKCGGFHSKRFESSLNETTDLLMKRLDITEEKSREIIKHNDLLHIGVDHLKAVFSIFESFGYGNKEILNHVKVLRKSKRRLREEHAVLEEIGFSNLSLSTLLQKFMRKNIYSLKLMNLIPPEVNVPQMLASHLHPRPTDFDVSGFTDHDILSQVHGVIVKRYLQWRLEATVDEIETFFRIYPYNMRHKSLRWFCENIEIAIDLGFTPRKLLSFGYLVHNDPEVPKEVLAKIPTFAGADMRVMMRRYPKLVTIPLKQYLTIYDILKEEEIPDLAIQRQMNIFSLLPSTIKTRFNEIREIPEMNVLRQNTRILRLIIHYNRARSRLSFIHQLQLKCTTMCLLDHDDEKYFNHRVRNNCDMNILGDVLTLLKHLLKSSSPEIEFNLRKHPYYLQIPLINIEKTCKHVQKSFSNSAIIKVAPILLYPSEKIDNALNQIKLMTDLPPTRLTETKKLNLALYLIEKNHHFTGDGVWESSQTAE